MLAETAVLGCHFQIISFYLKVGLEGEWAKLEFKVSMVVFFLRFNYSKVIVLWLFDDQ